MGGGVLDLWIYLAKIIRGFRFPSFPRKGQQKLFPILDLQTLTAFESYVGETASTVVATALFPNVIREKEKKGMQEFLLPFFLSLLGGREGKSRWVTTKEKSRDSRHPPYVELKPNSKKNT